MQAYKKYLNYVNAFKKKKGNDILNTFLWTVILQLEIIY